MKGVFRSQVTVDLQRAFDCLKATDAERVVLGYVREQSWNRAIARKVKASDPWPDALPCVIDVAYLADRTGTRASSIEKAIEHLLNDGILAEYQGGVTINKFVENWSRSRISRAALEYARSAQAIPHPTAGHPVEYPGPRDASERTEINRERQVADADDISDWTEEVYAFRIPVARISPLLGEGYTPAAVRDALAVAFGRAFKRTAEGLSGYAASCLSDWKARNKLPQPQAPSRSPPRGHGAAATSKDASISRLFEEASLAESGANDVEIEKRTAAETQQSA